MNKDKNEINIVVGQTEVSISKESITVGIKEKKIKN